MQLLSSATAAATLAHDNLPLQASFFVAGSIWDLRSNSEEILQAMQETFDQVDGERLADLHLRFHVDFAVNHAPLLPTPYFIALDHLYYATYGPCDSMLVDQLGHRVIGSFSPAASRDV